MRAVRWEDQEKIQVETVPHPVILNPRDAIVKVTTTAICGSDLHIYEGYIPTMQKGDVLGHEFMGEVVKVVMKPGDTSATTVDHRSPQA
jgi:threonine dehydrogenase-like Zn-dependent dehydrogenase